MGDKKYRVLFVNEDVLANCEEFEEYKGPDKETYDYLKRRNKNVIELLYYILFKMEIKVSELEGNRVKKIEKCIDLEKEYTRDLKKYAGKEKVSEEFLNILLGIYVAQKNGAENEKKYAQRMWQNLKIDKEIEGLLITGNTYFQNMYEKRNLEKELLKNKNYKKRIENFIQLFKASFGLNMYVIDRKGKARELIKARVDKFFSDIVEIQQEIHSGIDLEVNKILTIIDNVDLKAEDFKVRVINSIKDAGRTTKISIEESSEYIILQLEKLQNIGKRAEREELDNRDLLEVEYAESIEDIKEIFSFLRKNINIKLDEIYNEYKQYFAEDDINFQKIRIFKENWNSLCDKVERIKQADQDVIDIGSIIEEFKCIDFEQIKSVQDYLQLYIQKKKRNEVKINTINGVTISYSKLKKAFNIVWNEAFDSFYRKVMYESPVFIDYFKKDQGLTRKIQAEREENNINRFFIDRENNIAIMTYSYTGSNISKYDRAAIILDYDIVEQLRIDSRKSSWNGKEDRSTYQEENGTKHSFMTGTYLFTKDKKIFSSIICNIMDDGFKSRSIPELKNHSNYYVREGHLFDFRKCNIRKNDIPVKVARSEYGKIGYICNETEHQYISQNFQKNERGAGGLYIEDPLIILEIVQEE